MSYILCYTDSYSFDTCELVFDDCTVEFYFSSNKLNPILISNAADYDCLTIALPWIIAASAVALILLIGILTLIFLKLCLVILVSTALHNFSIKVE